MEGLKGSNVIVTGANRGIGRAVVDVMARKGANVWACARQMTDLFEKDMRRLSEECGVWVEPVCFDLQCEDEAVAAAKRIVAEKKPIDALVNNAGVGYTALLQMSSRDKLHEVFQVNFFSMVALTQYVARIMCRQGRGSIVNVSSFLASRPTEGRAVYGASKAAVESMTIALAKEVGPKGVRVNAIAPGVIDTDFTREGVEDAALSASIAGTCLKRMGTPEEVAKVVAFLSSDEASYLTGHVVRVDGGME